MDERFEQRSPEDLPANAKREHQMIPFPPQGLPQVPEDAASEAITEPSLPGERELLVDESGETSYSNSPQSSAPSAFDIGPASYPTPETDDDAEPEPQDSFEGGDQPGTTFNTDIHGDVDKLVQAGTYEHKEYHQHGERLRITDITVDDLEGNNRNRFVKPDSVVTIESELFMGERQVALLAIEEGGRNTTARFLVSAGNQKPRRIHPPAELVIEPWQLKKYDKSAFLLDLSDIEIEEPERLLENLSGLHEDLRTQESFLVVVFGETDLETALCEQFGVIGIARPDPYEILSNHLVGSTSATEGNEDGVGTAENSATSESAPSSEKKKSGYAGAPAEWVTFARNRGLLDRKPPAEALRLRKAINEALDHWNSLTPAGQASLKEEFKERRHIPWSSGDRAYAEQLVLDRFQAWVAELDLWNHDNQRKPRLRAFQLAAAVVPTGDPIRIRTEATALLQTITRLKLLEAGLDEEGISDPALGEPVWSGPGTRLLARDSLAELRDGKVVFTRPGFAEAVVRYFWNDWPEYRSALIDWLMNLATSDTFTSEERDRLKNQVGKFAIHHAQERGEFGFLYDVVAKWAGVDTTLPDAAKLLEQAATTSGIASAVRDRTRQWAKKGDSALRRVVAELCASPTFALEYPRLVTTRLVHLMERRQAGDEDSALDAALERASRLLVTEAHQSNAVLARLSTDARAEQLAQRKRAVRLFLSVAQARVKENAEPALIPKADGPESSRKALVALWASTLRVLKHDESVIQPAFNAWMDACAPTEMEREVISVFRNAIADRWEEAGEADHVLARLSGRWKAVTSLPLVRATELDQRLLAASRDAMFEITRQTFPDQRFERG
ncbi:hypothetical protein [Glycomyces albidus]|uniref:Uncharacterized protein n=1 Tax=Glycomyces albidus TaxID=2656774 RepID=A0A6L5G4S2_9ACTN|nr:hypothetical protein [Glycomyces albidus]MQM24630.1 hypothetical protein [Glycomyces albidus]